jgi:serine/threonine protein kinase
MISIDGYADIERIGQGGLGDVYRATQRSTGGTVAIKVLRDVSDESVAWHRTRRELTALVSLAGHANVIQLSEVLDLPEGPALVMEYAPGGSVAELMLRRDRPLTVGETVFVGRQTATALDAAHERGIVHRDVKPQNLLIDAYGQVKLCDFGIAAMMRSDEFQARTSAISMRYASPEDLDDDTDVGPPSDVYSLGATMLHLSRGAPPTLKERLTPWVPPATDDAELAALDTIVAACLYPAPAQRPSAAHVADELERLGWAIDERQRALAFEAVDLTTDDDLPTDRRPDRESSRGFTNTAASAIESPDPEVRAEEVPTVPPSTAAPVESSPVVHPAGNDADTDDTVYRSDRRPPRPEPPRPRRRWPIALAAGGAAALLAVVFWPRGDDPQVLEFVERPADLVDIREVDWPIGDVGECLIQRDDALEPVGCADAHDLQRFAVGQLAAASLPSEFDADIVEASARASCDSAFVTFVGVEPDASDLQVAIALPSAVGFELEGDRTFQCLLGVAGRRMIGDARASER